MSVTFVVLLAAAKTSAAALPSGDAGAVGWARGFWLLCGLFILLRLWVGWREGLARQLFALAALGLAYGAAFVGGPVLAPGLRPFLPAPDFLLSVVAGAGLGFVVYQVTNILGRTLCRRTGERAPGAGRLVWGIGGAVLGGMGALAALWVVFIGVRLLGSIAEGRVRAEQALAASPGQPLPSAPTSAREVEFPRDYRGAPTASRRIPVTTAPTQSSFGEGLRGLARVKDTLETGVTGEVMSAVDPVPAGAYTILNKLARVVSDPAALERFRNGFFVRELGADPRLTTLLDDPSIARELAAGDYRALLAHPRLRAAANDPTLAARVRSFDLERALDEALRGKL